MKEAIILYASIVIFATIIVMFLSGLFKLLEVFFYA